jgi:hypothetical protein
MRAEAPILLFLVTRYSYLAIRRLRPEGIVNRLRLLLVLDLQSSPTASSGLLLVVPSNLFRPIRMTLLMIHSLELRHYFFRGYLVRTMSFWWTWGNNAIPVRTSFLFPSYDDKNNGCTFLAIGPYIRVHRCLSGVEPTRHLTVLIHHIWFLPKIDYVFYLLAGADTPFT